ncbi:MAG: glycosyltransferase [Ardenticatenaceae bacterium]|nr:glycosyltransferase [Anaerolineales bacterium]MCB8977041.1 glycosyltransferase [Ardenticatenaceae bacterium]
MKVSVIATVKNEGEALRPLLDSLIQQSQLPDELIFCDGGSTDSTLEILTEYKTWLPLKILVAPDANISQGRNLAIAAAAGPIIAATDAGVVLAPYWLEELVQPIVRGETAVASGWFEPDPYTDFEVVMGSTVLPTRREIVAKDFLPSSRSVAFLKSAWEEVGGYPEWLDYSEDLVFDFALRERYGDFPFVDTAVAYFRPRGDLTGYFKQYYRYARGDGKANLWPKRHLVRYFTYLVALPYVLRLIWREKWAGWVLLLVGSSVYCQKPAQRLWGNTWGWRPPSRVRAFALIPLIRLVGDVAKMLGYPVGLLWRWQHRDVIR